MRRLVIGPAVAGLLTLSLVTAGLVAPAVSALGSAVQFTASATTAPADGTSTITLTFAAYDTATNVVDMSLTHATFGTASAGSGITVTPHFAWTPGSSDIAPGATLTIVAPKTAGVATLTVYLAPRAGGVAVLDSTTQFTFTAVAPTPKPTMPSPRAYKLAFYESPNSTCAAGAQPAQGAKAEGFAIVRVLPSGKLLITVQLKRAAARATYDVWVNQDPGACPLASATKLGAIHTNRKGMGHAVLRVPYVAGATHVWLSVTNPSDGTDVLRTKAATLK